MNAVHQSCISTQEAVYTLANRMSCNRTRSVSKFVSTSGGRAPHPDHVPVLARNGMALVRRMELQHADTDGIKRLGRTGMQQLAPSMQVCCPASFLQLLYYNTIL